MVLAYPGPQDRTTDVLVRLDALEDPGLVVQVQAQNSHNLDSALHIAQRMEAVFQTVHSRDSKPVQAVRKNTALKEVQHNAKDPWVEQLTKAVQ